jgi:hypothetical protein
VQATALLTRQNIYSFLLFAHFIDLTDTTRGLEVRCGAVFFIQEPPPLHTMSLFGAPEVQNTLFGFEIPFPRKDLLIALCAVCGFLPVTVLLHSLITRLFRIFFGSHSKRD